MPLLVDEAGWQPARGAAAASREGEPPGGIGEGGWAPLQAAADVALSRSELLRRTLYSASGQGGGEKSKRC